MSRTGAPLYFHAGGCAATAYQTPEGFLVLAGSTGRENLCPSAPRSAIKLRDTLERQGVIEVKDGQLVLLKEYVFRSPTAAGCFLIGSSINGGAYWRNAAGQHLNRTGANRDSTAAEAGMKSNGHRSLADLPADQLINVLPLLDSESQAREVARLVPKTLEVLQVAVDVVDIVAVRDKVASILGTAHQLKLPELRDDAMELLRRADRRLGVAMREEQKRNPVFKPTDFVAKSELYGDHANGIFGLTDDITDAQFDKALAQARAESTLTRTNIIRKCHQNRRNVPPPHPPSEWDDRVVAAIKRDPNRTQRDIAQELGCSPSTVSKAIERRHIDWQKVAPTPRTSQWDELVAAAIERNPNRTQREIAKELGCSHSVVSYAVKRQHIDWQHQNRVTASGVTPASERKAALKYLAHMAAQFDATVFALETIDLKFIDRKDAEDDLDSIKASIKTITRILNKIQTNEVKEQNS